MQKALDNLSKAFKELGQTVYDNILIDLDELRLIVWDRNFWVGTLSFAAMVLVILIEGCMRRGV